MKADTSKRRVLVAGGDARTVRYLGSSTEVEAFASSRFGGNGSIHRAHAAIAGGGVSLVVLLVRWLGHADERSLVAACRAFGVPVRIVRGGLSALRQTLSGVDGAGNV